MLRIALGLAAALVLPLTFLLFAQWPLREWVQAGSREANDLGQIVFALYMAVAVTAASIDHAHLAARHVGGNSRGRAIAIFACTAPWAVFVFWTSAPVAWRSALQLERFGETLGPGYFILRIALLLLAALVIVHGFASLLTRRAQ